MGTLSIYTLVADGSTTLPNGEDRWQCRELANYVQTQVVNDIRADFDSKWSRRMLWNRSYSEARTTTVPGMLLEILSHLNKAEIPLLFLKGKSLFSLSMMMESKESGNIQENAFLTFNQKGM